MTNRRGRPVTLVPCPVCSTLTPASQFNRKKTACLACVDAKHGPAGGPPPIMRACPVCGELRRSTDFNRKKTACLGCSRPRDGYPVKLRGLAGEPPPIIDDQLTEQMVRSIVALETMDREIKAWLAETMPPKCSCCQHMGDDVGETENGYLLCELCWWDVQHVGQCQQHKNRAADPDPPIIFPEKVGRPLPERPYEMQLRLGLVVPPSQPLTPEEILAAAEKED